MLYIKQHYDIPRSISETNGHFTAQNHKDEDVLRKNHHSTQRKKKKKGSNSPTKSRSADEERSGLVGSLTSSSVDFVDSTEHVYEIESSEPIYESTDLNDESFPANTSNMGGSIYENAEFMRESLKRKSSSPAVMQDSPKRVSSEKRSVARHKSTPGGALSQKKPKRHTPDDYEDPDCILDETEDYIDMDGSNSKLHDMYIDPEDLRKGSVCSSCTSPDSSNNRMDSVCCKFLACLFVVYLFVLL